MDSGLKRARHPGTLARRRDAQSQVKALAAKGVRTLGVWASAGLLANDAHGLPVVVFCFLTLAAAAAVICALQRPWQAARRIPREEWARVVINGFLFGSSWLLWAKGLQTSGILKTIILEHSHVCITGVLALMATRKHHGSAASALGRLASGELLFVVALILLLYDGEQLTWGVAALLASSLMRAVWTRFSQKIARDIGGPKKLHALSLCAAAALLFPLVALDFLGEAVVGADYDYSIMSFSTLWAATGAAILALVLDFYADTMFAGVPMPDSITLVAGLATSALLGLTPNTLQSIATVCALFGLRDAARSTGTAADSLLPTTAGVADPGWSAADYTDASPFGVEPIQRLVQFILNDETPLAGGRAAYSVFAPWPRQLSRADSGIAAWSISALADGARRLWRHAMASPDSRRIVLFLLLNLAFMFVEILVGLWTNSLGLISDAGHMLFDCMALFIGLFASFVSRWNPDRFYTYGYARFETLCAFVNGVFLVFIAVFIMTESLERISDPPELGTSGLLTTSVLGLLVNMVGLVFFHGHSHLDGDAHGGHGHSHGGGGGHGHAHHGNENMHGVFLHILADALGSLGVIVSSLLIEYRGWFVADPICSLLISLLILSSVYPLLRATASALLLTVPPRLTQAFKDTLNEILLIEGVASVREPKIWLHSTNVAVVSVHVIIDDSWETQQILRPVEDLLRTRIPNLRHSTVQVYHKGTYYTLVESQHQRNVPVFWSPDANDLTRATEQFLTPESKAALAQRMGRAAVPQCTGHHHQLDGHGHAHHHHQHHHHHHHDAQHDHAHAHHGHAHQAQFTL